ncbi:4Fe-4S dicluster domain-containing protein [Mumia sp. zg.B53]|uniref:4Fe-4S dicluster domain-containing protein n=1 Tax=unclassified Mumia TaxID=2621872 RepID=UPI001C6F4D63|nr:MULTISPECIES: 4Fe-4S dicluster domain-containing protein [unclassified Mumia]MBW9206344.1 4Fe-4S dicluster domain-containing protein [Mumia sp. zg.B17]MBW9211362.1 4Fe-4S dicluster domain-containing protein [Mumia sp. zg.B21]MBW9215941.1 4Fe-4S dicluster domain-containing protein [Mumia sp. zg.B53]MDD9349465.1 4Fe-4S dicluster domain-containing protein [Mumia sp.]
MTSLFRENDLWGPLDPSEEAGYGEDRPKRKGFFTDTSICIGCKACEVACKEWNDVPADHFDMLGSSYDNSHSLNANQWRHVAFIEQPKRLGDQESGLRQSVDLGMPVMAPSSPPEEQPPDGAEKPDFRWLMSSDVCKHCTHAACLDVCPTGSLFRSEFGTVVVQDDICNGCGYCVPACPYGVIERRKGPDGAKNVGIAQKCTLCYDRLEAGQTPACAQACPTQSIQFGDVEELRERANTRVAQLNDAGVMDARLYGNDPDDGVGGAGAFFLLLDEPEVYGFPPDPVVTTRDLPHMFRRASAAAAVMLAGAAVSFLGRRR